MSSGIYLISNNINQKVYIGKSKNIQKRFQEHIYEAFQRNSNRHLCRAIRKYGKENFKYIILEEITLQDYDNISNEKERYWINKYNSFENGYNMTEGGDGGHPRGYYIGGFANKALATQDEVYEIRLAYKNLQPKYKVYEKYKNHISKNAFDRIWQHKTWIGILDEIYTEEMINLHYHSSKPPNTNAAKLTKEQVIEIKKRLKNNNETDKDLAKQFNVHEMTISRIRRGKTWKNIEC